MSRTAREQEAYLVQQYFNGSYSDKYFDCTCSDNVLPKTATPVIVDTGERTPTAQPKPVEPAPVVTPTMEQQIEDVLNRDTVQPPLMPLPDDTYPSNQFIEEPNLPTGIGDLMSQTGNSESGGSLSVVEGTKEPTKAGGLILGLLAAGLIARQVFKGGKKAKKVTL